MNKYLEKIAARTASGNKVELEPGVNYDLNNHEIKPTTAHMRDYIDRQNTIAKLLKGSIGATYGGVILGALGSGWAKKNLAKPITRTTLRKQHPVLGGITAKYGSRAATRGFGVLGGLTGAVVGGGLTYAIGDLEDWQKKDKKERYMAKLESKYQDRINELEGWTDL